MFTHTLGFSRMGKQRELKKALEAFWKGDSTEYRLEAAAKELRLRHWQLQRDCGIDLPAVGDFSLYDHVLDMSTLLGAIPERFGRIAGRVDLAAYFLMARGGERHGRGVPPLEMSKWFDTNYHYLVPEFSPGQRFDLSSGKIFREAEEAAAAGLPVQAVLVGPLTYLHCGKSAIPGFDRFTLLPQLLEAYGEIVARLSASCEWIQIDEPILALDLPPALSGSFRRAYTALVEAAAPAKILVATYFGSIAHNLPEIAGTPLAGLHLDLVRAPEQLAPVLKTLPEECQLSLGVVDGRNVWRVDARKALVLIEQAAEARGLDRLMLAPSCSLLHVPVDLSDETELPQDIRSWMAFAREKCLELRMLADAAQGRDVTALLAENQAAWESRRQAPALRRPEVRQRLAAVSPDMLARPIPYVGRRFLQSSHLGLPLLPTTTIGSFPQTPDIRNARLAWKTGAISQRDYTSAMRSCIEGAVRRQEELGLDVLVHGEPERNDMVEFFGQNLEGFAFTANGWVQSYGTRCVKPPIIVSDVRRARPLTVDLAVYAQSLSPKPVKGMLTGPVTILNWSFPREDIPLAESCFQIARAIREEALDLERNGIKIIQIDEAALKEKLPLRESDRGPRYLDWAIPAFRLCASGLRPETQVHTHMCYSEFADIVSAIDALDADVITFEAARSNLSLLDALADAGFETDVGPGVYDIHSPRVPSVDEIASAIRVMLEKLGRNATAYDGLWVNPDCGLKTRGVEETVASLRNLVAAAKSVREGSGT